MGNFVWGKCTPPTLHAHANMQPQDFSRGDTAYHLYTLVWITSCHFMVPAPKTFIALVPSMFTHYRTISLPAHRGLHWRVQLP